MTEPNKNESDKEEKKKPYVDRLGRSQLLKELERHIDWKMQDARMRGCSPCLDLAVLTVADGRMLVTGVHTRGTTVYLDISSEMALQYNRLDPRDGVYNTPRPNTRVEDPPTRAIDLPTLIHKLDLMSGEEVRFPDGSFIVGITMLSHEAPFPMPAIAAASNVSASVVTLVQSYADEGGGRSHDGDNKSGRWAWADMTIEDRFGSTISVPRLEPLDPCLDPCLEPHTPEFTWRDLPSRIAARASDEEVSRNEPASEWGRPLFRRAYAGVDYGEGEEPSSAVAAAPAPAAAVDPVRDAVDSARHETVHAAVRDAVDSAVRAGYARSDQAFARVVSDVISGTQAGQLLRTTTYAAECAAECDSVEQDTGEPAGG